MQTVRKISLFLGVLSLFNSGLDGVFHVDVLQKLFVNTPLLLYLIQLNGFFAGGLMIFSMFDWKQ